MLVLKKKRIVGSKKAEGEEKRKRRVKPSHRLGERKSEWVRSVRDTGPQMSLCSHHVPTRRLTESRAQTFSTADKRK
jgi:hypothetical protein